MAIAFGAITSGSVTTGNSVSSPDVSGTNLIGVIGVFKQTTTGADSITWNGVSCTKIAGLVNTLTFNNEIVELWYIINPATGVTNVTPTFTSGGSISLRIAYYTGAKQSAQPEDSSTLQLSSAGTTLSIPVDTTTDNAWLAGMARNGNGNLAAGTDTNQRSTGSFGLYDGGPKTPAGTFNLVITGPNTDDFWGVAASFAPAAASGPANLKSYNTNLKANIKSVNTNLIANVKSLNTNV